MNHPLVSIVMATYNDSRYLKGAIDSVLKQTFRDWEFIILNDASTDETDKIISSYVEKDSRFVYINNAKNAGLTKNLNKGIDIAQGEFIARIDSDDEWVDEAKLKQQ